MQKDNVQPHNARAVKPVLHNPEQLSLRKILTEALPLQLALPYILKLLLPPVCLLCDAKLNIVQNNKYLCPDCARACMNQPPAACPVCAEPYQAPSAIEHRCTQCTVYPPPFKWLKAIGLHELQLQHAVHQLKYAGQFQLALALALLVHERLRPDIDSFVPQAIVPVPLHPQRLRSRGFNQSLLIARCLGVTLNIPVYPELLIRTRPTHSQTNLTRQQRHQNIKGAFALKYALESQRILLIDDVATTTATCRECAKILTQSGHQIAVITLSRARIQY